MQVDSLPTELPWKLVLQFMGLQRVDRLEQLKSNMRLILCGHRMSGSLHTRILKDHIETLTRFSGVLAQMTSTPTFLKAASLEHS